MQAVPRVELLPGMDSAVWAQGFVTLARHLPGLGGVPDYNALEPAEFEAIAAELEAQLKREAAAAKRPRR